MEPKDIIRAKYELLSPQLNEKTLRLFAAAEAKIIGHGGIAMVSSALNISRDRIVRGLKELESCASPDPMRIRIAGGGRKKQTDKDATLKSDLKRMLDPHTRGDPESSLCWTSKSLRNLEHELRNKGHKVCHSTVAKLLKKMGFSLQGNKKVLEGKQHPDRDAQFVYINKITTTRQDEGQPVISVDAKKKELIGEYKNNGKEWNPKKDPTKVQTYDFIDKELGKVAPYGVYDCINNLGWVSVGIDNDTAAFAVTSIDSWWNKIGKQLYPKATKLLITADSGGSNASRSRLWKFKLQEFANKTSLSVSVCHFPPGTSKWNKIEHRMFSFISKNWRGRPLVDHATVVNLIGSTKTKKGLKIHCQLDTNSYPKGIKISDKQLSQLNIERDSFHGDWNYTVHPKEKI